MNFCTISLNLAIKFFAPLTNKLSTGVLYCVSLIVSSHSTNSLPAFGAANSFKVVPFDIRKKLEPKFIFNEKTAYILKDKKIHKEVRIKWGKVDKWQALLNRVYKKNE